MKQYIYRTAGDGVFELKDDICTYIGLQGKNIIKQLIIISDQIKNEILYALERFKCVATLAKDFLTSLSENHSPNVSTAIFMPRTSPSPHARSRALSPSALR